MQKHLKNSIRKSLAVKNINGILTVKRRVFSLIQQIKNLIERIIIVKVNKCVKSCLAIKYEWLKSKWFELKGCFNRLSVNEHFLIAKADSPPTVKLRKCARI